MSDFPHVLNTYNHSRKGQRCRIMPNGYYGEKVQVEFEDGTTLIVNRVNLGGRKKKYYEKRGRPAKKSVTLAGIPPPNEGEV